MNVKNVGGCADVSLLMIRGVNLLYVGVACLPASANVLQLPIHRLENLLSVPLQPVQLAAALTNRSGQFSREATDEAGTG